MPKVWNISDHPGTSVPPKSMVLFGKSVKPGSGVEVPADRLAAAEKMSARVDVHVGDKLPQDYLYAKGAYKAERMPRSMVAHATDPKAKPNVTKAVKASKAVKVEKTPEPEKPRVEEPKTEESKAPKGSKR